MRTLLPAIIALEMAGCGRWGFDTAGDASRDAIGDRGNDTDIVDTAIDGRDGPELCGMLFGTWTLTAPVVADDVNNLLIAQNTFGLDRNEYDPVVSADGISLHFTSDNQGAFEAYRADRAAPELPFSTMVKLGTDVNDGASTVFGFQPIGVNAVVSAGYGSPVGGLEYWRGVFSVGIWTWTLSNLSTAASDLDARMSADGLTLFYANGADIFTATRTALGDDFGMATPITDINSPSDDDGPSPTTTGILFASNRPGSAGDKDLYLAERTGQETYGAPYRLEELASPSFDGEPVLYEPGCELLFVSTRSGAANIYRTRVVPR